MIFFDLILVYFAPAAEEYAVAFILEDIVFGDKIVGEKVDDAVVVGGDFVVSDEVVAGVVHEDAGVGGAVDVVGDDVAVLAGAEGDVGADVGADGVLFDVGAGLLADEDALPH